MLLPLLTKANLFARRTAFGGLVALSKPAQTLFAGLPSHPVTTAAPFAALSARADQAKDLARRLYVVGERKGWAEEARAYNALVVAWPEIASLVAKQPAVVTGSPQQTTLA